MKIKAWGSVLLLSCLCSAVTAQNGNRYLEKPLPRGWGNTVIPDSKTVPTSTGTANSTTASADDNLFSGQILPVDDQWWKAFNDPVLDSLISSSIRRKLFRTCRYRPYGTGTCQPEDGAQ